jgi:hypothetical protein
MIFSLGSISGWGRFGDGLYFAPNSSKAHDYSDKKQSSLGTGRFIMLLNKVACGKPYRYTTDQQHLTGPPSGFDCVLGEVGPVLNYPELVVYKESAAVTTAIVIYNR